MATPEAEARQKMDAALNASGWIVQDYKAINLGAGKGIAIREVPLKSGRCDYLLVVDRRPVGVIEAKKQGTTLSTVADQSAHYAANLPTFLADQLPKGTEVLPFCYESTGIETYFRDERDPHPRSRTVFSFHRPETLADWLDTPKSPSSYESPYTAPNETAMVAEVPPGRVGVPPGVPGILPSTPPHTLRARLAQMPFVHPLPKAGMRECQIEAITKLEQSFAEAKPRALIQMATGAGKTFTACAATYRLIKHAGARRVLFLVDRSSLGTQARDEFHKFITPDTGRKFTDLYNVQHLTSNKLDPVCRVTICTIQRLYSMLRGDAELPEGLDDVSVEKLAVAPQSGRGVPPLVRKQQSRDGSATFEVAYNPAIPIEFFDFIVTDECHRSIYNLWRQVLEYFDAFLVGLTATPALQTIAFFQQNLVMEYGHERAVADGVNVGYDVYRINTEVTAQGGKVDKGFVVDKRSRATRSRRQQLLDEDLAYAAPELDRSVVVPSQIRTVLQTFKDALETVLFPGRTLVPKTLIFAKDDSHAEDIVHLVREVFGRGNDFAKKITYRAVHAVTGQPADCEQLIREFRLSPQLRIAVTVDMIATGTDIKPLEVLLFLRDVRSRVYFEQMKGRGTRVLTASDMQAVSGEDARAKDHFVIVDAVGVCDSDKTESRPLERLPTVALDKMLKQVAFGDRSEDTLTSLASRLARLDRAITAPRRAELAQLAGGKTLAELSAALLRAFDPDIVAAASRRLLLDRLNDPSAPDDYSAPTINYFDPESPIENLSGDLPHWRQQGTTYFVTFRLADSLPQEKLVQWRAEMDAWLQAHPEPHDEATRREFYNRFPARVQRWLDAGYGSCILEVESIRTLVETALKFFDRERYALGEFVVANNHVHALVTPLGEHTLSEILHSWKSFTAHEIVKDEALRRRLAAAQGKPIAVNYKVAAASRRETEKAQRRDASVTVWQKESFDHIVRSPASLEKFREYIRAHTLIADSDLCVSEDLRRDAAATLLAAACKPFDEPGLRDAITDARKEADQIIDVVTVDKVTSQGFDAAAKEKAEGLVREFRQYIEEHRAEIGALQILYSRPFKQRLTEEGLKELEAKLKQDPHFGPDPVTTLWRAFERRNTDQQSGSGVPPLAPRARQRRDAVATFTDLVSLVRFALEQEPVLEPFEEHVKQRFAAWLEEKRAAGITFSADQLAWLQKMRDYISASGSVDRDHLEIDGILGPIYRAFGERLWPLMDELNLTLAA